MHSAMIILKEYIDRLLHHWEGGQKSSGKKKKSFCTTVWKAMCVHCSFSSSSVAQTTKWFLLFPTMVLMKLQWNESAIETCKKDIYDSSYRERMYYDYGWTTWDRRGRKRERNIADQTTLKSIKSSNFASAHRRAAGVLEDNAALDVIGSISQDDTR